MFYFLHRCITEIGDDLNVFVSLVDKNEVFVLSFIFFPLDDEKMVVIASQFGMIIIYLVFALPPSLCACV